MFISSKETLGNKIDTVDWIIIDRCPSCKSCELIDRGNLPLDFYDFAGRKFDIKGQNISIFECKNCRLVYKNKIPSPEFISQQISGESNTLWSYNYSYENEIKLINGLFDYHDSYDLLDIGAANGDLLKVSAKFGGRRSALDITRYPGLQITDDGEFIQGLLDDSSLVWRKKKYDIVTLFDVLEHLYDPVTAFSNLRDFVKEGGFVIVETGDSDKYWYKQNEISHWQYVRLFEHHIFWNYYSVAYQAQKNGFEIVSYTNKQNKYIEKTSIPQKLENLSMLSLYIISRQAYHLLGKIMNKHGIQPMNIFAKDHFRLVLRRVK